MKTLLANGCSFTWGAGLVESEREEQSWPNQVKELLGYDQTVNLAAGCGSNQRIVRTIIQWILSQPSNVLQNTLAIIQFADLHRYEYYIPKQNNVWENHQERWVRNKVDAAIVLGDFLDKQEANDYNNIRLSTYSDIEGYWNWVSQCETLSSLFNRFGIKYYFWQISGPRVNPDKIYYEFLRDSYNWINNDINFDCRYERISSEDSHPSIKGHKQLAEYLVKYMQV